VTLTFETALLNAIEVQLDDVHVTATERLVVLERYTTESRLRIALPLLAARNPGRKFKHAEIAAFVSASREKTTRALLALRASGEYRDELTDHKIDVTEAIKRAKTR
jgi:CRP-like cAMP-binding protein